MTSRASRVGVRPKDSGGVCLGGASASLASVDEENAASHGLVVDKVGDPSTFDVFDPEGFFLGSIDLGITIPYRNRPALVGDTLIVVTPGLLDVPFLVRLTIRRP